MDLSLTFNSKMEAYYQTFFELQEKLRKSEEERLKLEMKFNELVQISREEEQAHYKKLRSQYKKFLEEDRKRQERNEKIVRTLERIESRVNMLTSKTERIKLLRRQYQSYIQRISRRPDYFPSKIVEELPRSGQKFVKNPFDDTMLKKAYGKTNDEKIEILDKYLQSFKSEKLQATPADKPKENKTETNQLKYLDEISKKFDSSFNSNEANSIAEEIMNSIYSRHYKKDLATDEVKKPVSKFTVPNITPRFELDKNTGYGDRYNKSDGTNFQRLRRSPKREVNGETSEQVGKSDDVPNTWALPKENVYKNERVGKVNESYASYRPSKTEIDLSENEKETDVASVNNGTVEVEEPEAQCTGGILYPNIEDENVQNEPAQPYFEESLEVSNEDQLDDALVTKIAPLSAELKETEQFGVDTELTEEINDVTIKSSNVPEQSVLHSNDVGSLRQYDEEREVEHEEEESTEVVKEPIKMEENAAVTPAEIELANNTFLVEDQNYDQYENQTVYDETAQLQPEYETNQTYNDNKNAQPYEQTDYDSNEQPIEQLYGDDGNAVHQYDESGQPVYSYDQQYNEDQQIDTIGAESNVTQQQGNYDETTSHQMNEQYNTDNQLVQQYDENGQPIQQYDESGQPIQQYNENCQPIQHQYDESGQLVQQYDVQYDESGQAIQHYDESGQPVQHYDEIGQPLQQYDENGQPVYYNQPDGLVQYDESGQVIQQYNENEQLVSQQEIYDQSYLHYEANNQYNESNIQQERGDLSQAQNVEEQKIDDVQACDEKVDDNPSKKKNILDLLDTDSESVKQNTSKISNDSDFDFSTNN